MVDLAPANEQAKIFSLIGEGALLVEVYRMLIERGHKIARIYTWTPQLLFAAGAKPSIVRTPPFRFGAWLRGEPCDYLLSINNRAIISRRLIGHPRERCINYHDSALPRYAGLRATAWAIFNGETSHGVTWHEVEQGIDAGAVFQQEHFAIPEGATTASLNEVCFHFGIQCFAKLIRKIEARTLSAIPQSVDAGARYYGAKDVLPNDGYIDWRESAESILRSIRSADWGPLHNDFGRVKIYLAQSQSLLVRNAERLEVNSPFEAGTVLEIADGSMTVQAKDAALRFTFEGAPPGAEMLMQTLPVRLPTAGEHLCEVVHSEDKAPVIPRQIWEHAQATPNALAVWSEREELDYEELVARAENIAGFLQKAQVQQDDIVAILSPRSPEAIISQLGVWGAGGAFLILNPDDPPSRWEQILQMASPIGVINCGVDHQLSDALQWTVWPYDEIQRERREFAGLAKQSPSALAYVIFTSGSSGQPKGCCIEHRSLEYFFDRNQERLDIKPMDRVLQVCCLSFDASVEEIFAPLLAGASVYLRPAELMLSMSNYLDFIGQHCISISGVFAANLSDINACLAAGKSMPETLRWITTGGEAISLEQVRRWQSYWRAQSQVAPVLENVYGLTETTIGSLYYDLNRLPEGVEGVFLGNAPEGTIIEIRDEQGRVIYGAGDGELVIGGPAVSRGYLLPELKETPQFFTENGVRFFRSRDRVTRDELGRICFIGRFDTQFKYMGFRLDAQEIEDACAQVYPDSVLAILPMGDQHEVSSIACVVELPDADERAVSNWRPSAESLQLLKARLPEYMLPTNYYSVRRMPLSHAGKVDRKELLAMLNNASLAHQSITEVSTMDGSELEPALLEIWRRVLNQPDISVDDDFFNSGGDSLSAIQLLMSLERQCDVRVDFATLFRHRTIRQLLNYLKGESRPCANDTPEHAEYVISLREGNGSPSLVLMHGLGGGILHYRSFAEHLAGDYSIYALVQLTKPNQPLPFHTFEELGQFYAKVILESCIPQPVCILGYSLGGWIAYETACHLHALGKDVARIFLVDAAATGLPLHLRIPASLNYRGHRLKTFIAEKLRSANASRQAEFVSHREQAPTKIHLRTPQLIDPFAQLVKERRPQPTPINAILFRSRQDKFQLSRAWKYLTDGHCRTIYTEHDHEKFLHSEGDQPFHQVFNEAWKREFPMPDAREIQSVAQRTTSLIHSSSKPGV